jgi:hypothetical protein
MYNVDHLQNNLLAIKTRFIKTMISKIQNYTIYFFCFLLFVFVQCDKGNEVNVDVAFTGIRPLIHFTTLDIPGIENMIHTNYWSVTKISQDYIAEYRFRWQSADKKHYVFFIVWINQSKEQAFKTLAEMHKYYSIPLHILEDHKDSPAFVGDLSYFEGQEFIRDNHIVRIHTSEKFEGNVSDIAKYIDQMILKSQTFKSIKNVKPKIDEFSIMSNPVIEKSKTPLKIQVSDPKNRNITYVWRFQHSGYGDISKDESGTYFYQSHWVDPSISESGLTLIAVNDYGFCADSTIYIKTI